MKKIKLKELKNGAYIQFLNDVLSIVKSEDSVKKSLEDFIVPLSVQVLKLERVYEVRGHELTIKIQEADKKRDQTFNGLKGIVKGYLKHHDSILVDHAKQVMFLIERYGMDISSLTYQIETENIKLLVDELMILENEQGALSHLGITSWVTDLNAFNNVFNTLYLRRNKDYATEGFTSVTAGRKETDAIYYKLIQLLDACILTKKGAFAYVEVRTRIQVLSKTYNEGLYLRKGKSESQEELDSK